MQEKVTTQNPKKCGKVQIVGIGTKKQRLQA
jgi:hypothetical protein